MTNMDDTKSHSEPISPTNVTLARNTISAIEPIPWQQRRITIIALGISFFLALVIIFVLPLLIQGATGYELKTGSQNTQTPSLKESPFVDVQLLKARRESQDSLSKFLTSQHLLEKKNVQLWGKEAFEDALKTGAKGDLLYRQRDFNQALILYEQARVKLAGLQSRAPEELFINLKIAEQAFSLGNATEAQEYYKLALSIDPSNAIAKKGLERAYFLNEVLALLKQANNALEEGSFEQAQEIFLKALNLDPLSEEAINGAEKALYLVTENQFIDTMSAGYQALENNQFNEATQAFQKALKLKPKNSGAFLGLTQAQSLSVQDTIKTQLNAASSQEAQEKWHQAAEGYGAILAKNSLLIEAQLGQSRNKARANLSDAINIILASPLRLASPQVSEHAKKLLSDAQKIKLPGPKHTQKINQLSQALEESQAFIPVQFRSNNSTTIVLLRHSMLGLFSEKQLSLKPGDYIALGSREGYRDVRIEFRVTPEKMPLSIEIVCEEPV
jgi:tetratricopeptide (TPR) repeat protein|tara:strand:+ start:4832 stop:6334 length:1503 start_codon:yes stop_codon:yes gene_type:complete